MAHLVCIIGSQKIKSCNWKCPSTDLKVWNSRNYYK